APYEGFAQALIRARVPYLPVHSGEIDRGAAGLSVLILANVGGLSDEECAAVRRFVARGGSLIATGESTLYNEWGDPRPDFALSDLLRVHVQAKPVRPQPSAGAAAGPLPSTPTFGFIPNFERVFTARRTVRNRQRPASATRSSRASKTPTSSRSAARCRRSAWTMAPWWL